jgi:predicted nucleic acid-binding protein
MSGFAFDSNILVDALCGLPQAKEEIARSAGLGGRVWISRLVWIEVMSKGSAADLRRTEHFLSGFAVEEVDTEIGARAAALRRERPRLKSADAIVLATAQLRNRVLVTRNIEDFPAAMPGIRVPYTL